MDVDRTIVSDRIKELWNLEAFPKTTKLLATFQDEQSQYVNRYGTVATRAAGAGQAAAGIAMVLLFLLGVSMVAGNVGEVVENLPPPDDAGKTRDAVGATHATHIYKTFLIPIKKIFCKKNMWQLLRNFHTKIQIFFLYKPVPTVLSILL